MHKVFFSSSVQERINLYATHYRQYYSDFYRDGGIWSEDQIIENYIAESLRRQSEMYDHMESRLSLDPIFWKTPDNTISIPWRSHYLAVSWEDDGDIRRVTHLEIR